MEQKKYYDAPESELMILKVENRFLASDPYAPKAKVENATVEEGSWD